ncbi:hypothetical protein Ahia01_000613100 [Argonauta hians]
MAEDRTATAATTTTVNYNSLPTPKPKPVKKSEYYRRPRSFRVLPTIEEGSETESDPDIEYESEINQTEVAETEIQESTSVFSKCCYFFTIVCGLTAFSFSIVHLIDAAPNFSSHLKYSCSVVLDIFMQLTSVATLILLYLFKRSTVDPGWIFILCIACDFFNILFGLIVAALIFNLSIFFVIIANTLLLVLLYKQTPPDLS